MNPNSHLKSYFFSFLFVCYAYLLSIPVSYSAEINLSRSKLIQLAQHLEVADEQLQYDFSRIAIIEMIRTYEQEYFRSQQNLANLHKTRIKNKTKKRAKIRGWQYSMNAYLETLDGYLFMMDSGVPLDFHISRQNKIIILIGVQPVIISGPNSGSDKQIEKNIVEEFCLNYECREYFERTHSYQDYENGELDSDESGYDDGSGYAAADGTAGTWSISSNTQADFIVSNGITFKFNGLKDRALKQSWVLQISEELIMLDENLHLADEKGISIQWPKVSLNELPLTDNAWKVIINNRGDYIKVTLPTLGENQSLFYQLKPWIKDYFQHKTNAQIIIDKADTYFYGL